MLRIHLQWQKKVRGKENEKKTPKIRQAGRKANLRYRVFAIAITLFYNINHLLQIKMKTYLFPEPPAASCVARHRLHSTVVVTEVLCTTCCKHSFVKMQIIEGEISMSVGEQVHQNN